MKRIISIILTVIMLAGIIAVPGVTASSVDEITTGSLVTFGSYPQTRVTDPSLLAELDSQALIWTDYDYYCDGKQEDYMKFADVAYSGERYRAVSFSHYRGSADADNSDQKENGYEPETVYWFKYEPIIWRVLDADSGFIMTEYLIDSQPFHNQYYEVGSEDENDSEWHVYGDEAHTYYASSWKNSSLRKWLNDDFFNTAFADEKSCIKNTDLTTPSVVSPENTTDKVFLLSSTDVDNVDYGFSNGNGEASNEMAGGTDYAKCQGLSVILWHDGPSFPYFYGSSNWRFRDYYVPYGESYTEYIGFDVYGRYRGGDSTNDDSLGIRPALNVDLRSGISRSLIKKVIYDPECGENLGYTIDPDGRLTITGSGDMSDYRGWGENKSTFYFDRSVKNAVIDKGVTSVGDWSFFMCSELESVSIPDGVKSIGSGAFSGCKGLKSVTIPDGVETIGDYAFSGCKGLKSVTIPGSVTSIGIYAFSGCKGLTNVTIPEGVTSIGRVAFRGCTGLTSIILPKSLTTIGNYMYDALPENTLIIGVPGSYAQQWAEEHGRAFTSVDGAHVTLRCPAAVNGDTVDISGFASPGAEVVISADDKHTATATASASGKWTATVKLEGVGDGDTVTVKATVTVGDKTAEASAKVKYSPDAVLLDEFDLSHSYYNYSVTAGTLSAAKRNFTFVPSKPLSFRIKVTNNERIDKLYIVSNKNGDVRQMELTYDETSGYWFANGFFGEQNTNYVPGEFTVKGVDKAEAEFDTGTVIRLNFLVDPSGYAYEAVKSNVLEGVTARVIYKDAEGHELLWNAEEYEQINPVTTLADGAFAWVVPEGTWQVRLSKDGYNEGRSEWMDVPPEHTNVYIPMISYKSPEISGVDVYADRAVISFSQYMDIASVNTDNVKFEGYSGTIAPVDKTETEKDSGIFYAKSFSFIPDNAFSGEVKATVENAANYAGGAMAAVYSGTFTVTAEPANLKAPDPVTVNYGRTKKITVTAENAAGRTVKVKSDSAVIELSADSLTFDSSGKATVSVKALMPGEAVLTFTVPGTALKASASVTVQTGNTDLIPGDVDGNGQILADDARLALRASAKLETLTDVQKLAADVDGDGKVLAGDARQILRFSAKLIQEFEKADK